MTQLLLLANGINGGQLLLIFGQAAIVAALIVGLFQARGIVGLVPLYITVGVIQHVQVVLASALYIELYPGIIVSPGSVVLFTACFFALLLVYVEQDAAEARKLCYGILGANLAMSGMSFLFALSLDGRGVINLFGLPKDFFIQNVRVMVVGTVVLIVDVFLVIYTYEWLSRRLPRSVFLRAGLTLVLILTIDTVVFVTACFSGSPQFLSILISGIVGKSVAALFYAGVLDVYLRWSRGRLTKERDLAEPGHPGVDDFHFLTFRQKYEMMKELHDELQTSQTQLREINESLDERVLLRTSELQGAQDDLIEKQQSLKESREQLRALAARLRRAQEDERAQMARGVHDELGQLLTGLKMDIGWLENRLSASDIPAQLNPLLDRAVGASELVDQTTTTVQNLAAKLRPSALDHLGLADAVKNYAREYELRFEIPITVSLGEPDLKILGSVGNELFFIYQEALTNVARHAKARAVEIRIFREGREIVLEVCDDGVGFKPSLIHSPKSLGLIGMEERAREIGGILEIGPQTSGGTCVRVRAPMPKGVSVSPPAASLPVSPGY